MKESAVRQTKVPAAQVTLGAPAVQVTPGPEGYCSMRRFAGADGTPLSTFNGCG